MRQKTKDRVERLVDELGKYEMNEERVVDEECEELYVQQ
jgi:hypothetical protein